MRIPHIVAALTLVMILTACAGPTPYQPNDPPMGGFSESRIEQDRFRVTFAGNSRTSREVVERSLLHRAAEVTLREGGDWFLVANGDTEIDRRTYVTGGFIPGPRLFGHRRGWRHGAHAHFGGGFFFGPGFYDVEQRTVEKYEAFAEIIIRKGAPPEDDPQAYDARDILATIGPTLRRPEES